MIAEIPTIPHPPEPRFAPIERPRGILMKVAYAMCRRMLGKVIAPMKVIYARKPSLLWISEKFRKIEARDLKLAARYKHLVKAYTSLKNGCAFCHDISLALAFQDRLGPETFRDLERFRDSAAFDDRDRAVLAYVDEIHRGLVVSDATFAELRRHFDEEEIVEITWINAVEYYYNSMAVPLGLGSDGLALSK